MLEFDAFEVALRDQSNHGHDKAPEPRHVNNLARLAICRIGEVGGASGRNREQRALASPGHASVNRAELHGHYMDIALREAAAQPLRENRERALGSAVHIVASAAAIAGDRSEYDDKAGALLLKMARGKRDQRHCAREILVDGCNCGARIDLRRLFIAKGTKANDDAIETAEFARR